MPRGLEIAGILSVSHTGVLSSETVSDVRIILKLHVTSKQTPQKTDVRGNRKIHWCVKLYIPQTMLKIQFCSWWSFLRMARWPLRVFEFTRQKTRNSLTIWFVNCTRRVNRCRGKLHRTVDNDLVKSDFKRWKSGCH